MPSVQRGFETPCVAAPSGGSGAGTCSNRALLLAKAPAKAAAAPKGGRFSLDQNVLWHLLELISPSAESRSTSCSLLQIFLGVLRKGFISSLPI